MSIRNRWALLLTLWTGCALAGPVALTPDHPESYVVKHGDTLWDIAGRFLQEPWRWPDIWQANPQIKNPNLIYPGDVITLDYEGGRARLSVQRGHPTVKLSPEVRVTPLPRAIPTVPIDAVRPFLVQPLVVNEKELGRAAYVVANSDGRIVSGGGDKVYARGIDEFDRTRFSVFRPGVALRDFGSNKVLGYEAVYVADAELIATGDISTLAVRNSVVEIRAGDRVLPVDAGEVQQNFMPRAPAIPVEGRIIATPAHSSRVGRYQVVVINLGQEDGMVVGDVLAVYHAGARVVDPVAGGTVELPDERAGVVMLFRTFDRVSYGLIMEAQRDITLYDAVTNPD
jgi:LysM domain-containing protein